MLFHDVLLAVFFFFASRRRHTILVSDWSSDVCSSDLLPFPIAWMSLSPSVLGSGVRLIQAIGNGSPPDQTAFKLFNHRRLTPYSPLVRSEERRVGKE